MKLLQKSDIAIAKARDASREVSEGLKLTRRVDSLRELRLSEEKKLEDWRRETLNTIQAEIDAGIEKKSELESQISLLELKLSELSPEMAAERLTLITLKKELAKWQKELEKKASKLLSDELEIAETIKEAQTFEKKSALHESNALALESSAEQKHQDAQNTLQQARTIHDQTVKERKDMELSLSLRENDVILREKKACAMELANIKQEKANQREQKRLVDVSQMLQRDLLRLKKLRTDVPR